MRARVARETERATHIAGLAGHHLAHRRDVVAVGKRAVAKRAVRVRAIVLADVAAASARRGESARGPATGEAGRARRAREETDARVTARQTARHVHAGSCADSRSFEREERAGEDRARGGRGRSEGKEEERRADSARAGKAAAPDDRGVACRAGGEVERARWVEVGEGASRTRRTAPGRPRRRRARTR